jgi:hypothetical protein
MKEVIVWYSLEKVHDPIQLLTWPASIPHRLVNRLPFSLILEVSMRPDHFVADRRSVCRIYNCLERQKSKRVDVIRCSFEPPIYVPTITGSHDHWVPRSLGGNLAAA